MNVKVRFRLDDREKVEILDLDDDWMYRDINDAFDAWIWHENDASVEILEVDGKPYEEEGP